ncbi:density-regulated protein homolog [Drosophila albomicans]|uniref:Density-regulated protein homolog n=1 Tax=Drosophila albomicans TaxID=7291 RepID=A0A6P8XMB5_DROAB|nr:density-regulated protein homolog [Drosophila albomicans]
MDSRNESESVLADIKYPLEVKYCGNCSMPIEYCEFYSEYEKCKEWLAKNLPEDYEKLTLREAEDSECCNEVEKKRQKRGGKGLLRVKKEKCDDDDAPKRICLSCATRGKNKRVTIVTGMSTFKIDLRSAAKFFGNKFACGASVTTDNAIVIQGDVREELFKVIPQKWEEVTVDALEDCGEGKKGHH